MKTLFLIDILYMKDINAVYGFNNGDFIIKQLSTLLQQQTKQNMYSLLKTSTFIEVNKLYVDVFAVTVYDDLDEHAILQLKDIIFKSIVSHKFKLLENTDTINLDITMGCSKSTSNDLRIYAEKALHNAKLNYLHFMYFDAKLFHNELTNINLIPVMNRNIQHSLVEPFFQPIVDTHTLDIYKYEALMRLYDDDGSIILPNNFLQKAKKYRLYNKLMLILISKVMQYIKTYKIHISINLDFNDILNPQIKNTIMNHLQEDNVGKYLTIEILESEKISNFEMVNDFISEVKKYHVQVAIDDFGTGFSNYEYILKLNVDYIKIDGSLIKKIDEEMYSNLVSSIVFFCKQHNIKVIAEFVKDLKTLRYVRSLGIDYSQGYYLGKPKHIKETLGETLNED